MSKKHKNKTNKKLYTGYLIVSCRPLSDSFECDAQRKPLKIVKDFNTAYEICVNQYNENKKTRSSTILYELYGITETNLIELIYDYEDIPI